MSKQENDDLIPTQTEGYKVSEKKNIDELTQLDANDASLNKWKESLGLNHAQERFPNDPRSAVVQALVFQSGDRIIRMDVSTPEAIKKLQEKPVVIKEGVEYTFKIEFVVQREVVSGLKFLQQIKRLGLPVETTEEMCGSYGPKFENQERTFPASVAPSGRLARGKYSVRSKFIDDDNTPYLEWTWTMEIKKDWE
ncbi:rho GDP dissociation inhibitor [Coemansia sp. RSA 2706]|nr:rho GDP dissociation inhibitor [Coemansia sp. RSA 2711]KAJ2299196.1 rho GDP dissociation inhibitor [Coemansia sp. RSA 2706]KAJ2309100.1 rho GDP dissociation inhibitor [Coemansia sp. RSA 2705]KAJ2323455.1 rho GDP dissociation inhibitor [Coemansia sp. RSA 2702]KAJ2363968.1 rho GDP dissociation inhibitor [Coemansia sp. RSA 2610]KAJ2728967.1 rho GDP dissociation inhibitor [Coemansia sp. Cherry 401B]